MTITRRVGALILILAALSVWFGMAPGEDDRPDHGSDIAKIEADDDGNNAIASGAPQQAVVNGWTSISYQRLLAEQMDEAASAAATDNRPAAMLGLCVAGIALLAFTARDQGGRPDDGNQWRNAPQPYL